MSTTKKEIKNLIDTLPDNFTWDDVMYKLYVRMKIEKGLQDIESGKTVSHEDVKKKFFNNQHA
ncbi:MAG: hypothetical protein KAS64_10135 [Spirochaetes bacterium]|nr:hypothetical protein [Spirochaetota bacterium]